MKIRCSALGKIMTNPKKKTETLSQTAKSYAEEIFKEELYNKKKQITSKYMDKGLIMEDDAIDYAAKVLDLGFCLKNEQYFSNEYLKGTPDLILKNEIIDIKCSYDYSTFPLFENDIPNKDYYYQLMGYMALTGKEKARLVYCLMDTPLNIVESEAKKMAYNGYDFEESLKELVNYHTYSNLINNLRIKTFEVQRDEEVIQNIYTRVTEVNNYINNLKLKL